MIFCGAAKSLSMGISFINVLYGNTHQDIIGLLLLPLIIYQAVQLIIGAIEVTLLKKWIKNKLKNQIHMNIQLQNQDESETININR